MTDWRSSPRILSATTKERLVQGLEQFLRSRGEILFVYLHGSFLTGGPFRDLDVAVYVEQPIRHGMSFRQYELDLSVELTLMTRAPVDVRILNDAPVAFRYHVLKGTLLLVKDREQLDNLRARTWDDYFDFAPFARRYLREAIGE
jgi:predicted nucleotidyltransferase